MKTVQLTRRYDLGSKSFNTLSFRAPRYDEYMKHGNAFEVQKDVGFYVHRDAVKIYADLLVEDLNPGVLQQLDLADTFLVEDTILSFFTEARSLAFRPDISPSDADSPTASDQ